MWNYMTSYGEERKRKRARARGLIVIEWLQALDKLLVVHRHFAALSHLSSSPPCHQKNIYHFVLSYATNAVVCRFRRNIWHIKRRWSEKGMSLTFRSKCPGLSTPDIFKYWELTGTHEKDVGIVTFVPDWLTSHQSHYCLCYNGILRFPRKRSMLKVK